MLKCIIFVLLMIDIAANVEHPEQLTGPSLEEWDSEHRAARELHQYIMRIESILDSANKYIFANLS